MGLSQTKLHHKVLQENWGGICRRLQTVDGKKWVHTKNPCGDYPLHLACYGGHAPPIVIRALLAAFPSAIHQKNGLGYKPLELARSNYREGHPFREEVLEYLEAYSNSNSNEDPNEDEVNRNDSNERNADGTTTTTTTTTTKSRPENTYYVTSTVCVVCLENKADHVVLPCGHLCLCGECAQKVMIGRSKNSNIDRNRNCPVGRCAFTSIVQVQGQVYPVE
jgi:hypothetical protein